MATETVCMHDYHHVPPLHYVTSADDVIHYYNHYRTTTAAAHPTGHVGVDHRGGLWTSHHGQVRYTCLTASCVVLGLLSVIPQHEIFDLEKFVFDARVRLPIVQVRCVYQGHRVKVKVTAVKRGWSA